MNHTTEEHVILVDTNDNEKGTLEKFEAHRQGVLHRAFSVFLFHPNGDLLLQQRNPAKYHSGGLWTNTCCSHPRPGEAVKAAAQRRLREEMGLDVPLQDGFSFIYRAELDHDLIEHELDHVFFGTSEATPHPDPAEVSAWKWISAEELRRDMEEHPEQYTAWFRIIFERAQIWYDTHQ